MTPLWMLHRYVAFAFLLSLSLSFGIAIGGAAAYAKSRFFRSTQTVSLVYCPDGRLAERPAYQREPEL